MIDEHLPLADVAAIIAEHLQRHGIQMCVIGGSAVTVHAPVIYTSLDIDLAILTGIKRRHLEPMLQQLGYSKRGRSFVHARSKWTVDIVADTPYIGDRAIREFAEIRTRHGIVRTYVLEDAIADRVAGWLFWSDSEALAVACNVLAGKVREISWQRVSDAILALDASDPMTAQRREFALSELRRVYSSNGGLFE